MSNQRSSMASTTPALLDSSALGLMQTANSTGAASSYALSDNGALPSAFGVLLIALIGLVAISRRRQRQNKKAEHVPSLPVDTPTPKYNPSVIFRSAD